MDAGHVIWGRGTYSLSSCGHSSGDDADDHDEPSNMEDGHTTRLPAHPERPRAPLSTIRILTRSEMIRAIILDA